MKSPAAATLHASISSTGVRRVSWLKRALPVMVLLVLLNLAAHVTQAVGDFGNLNERTARRLDTLATTIALRVQDRAKAVDHTFLMVDEAFSAGTPDDGTLARLAALDSDMLGNVSIAVFDSAGHVLASSVPPGDRNEAWFKALRGLTADPRTIAQLIHRDSGWSLLFIREHPVHAGIADMRMAVVVPVDQALMKGIALPHGSASLLVNRDDQVIAHYPSNPAVETGSVSHVAGLKREGPTPSTYYAISPEDGRERLKTLRSITVGNPGDNWTLELGYAVDEYRAPWLRSLFLNLLGIAIEVTLLIAGIVMLRRENRLHEEIENWSGLVSTVVRDIPTPVALVDVGTGKIALANEAFRSLFGARGDVGERLAVLFAEPASWTGMYGRDDSEPVSMLTSAGAVQMIVRCSRLLGGVVAPEDQELVLVTLLDVSRQCAQISQLRMEADFDALTKLPNRRSFTRASARAVAYAREHGSPLAVLALDLDHFKRVNDTWGHAAGDRVLEGIADRINGALRNHDMPARVGGEEFAVILQGATPEQARGVAERIRLAVAEAPIVLGDGRAVSITTSIGISMYQYGEPDLTAAQARADAALYSAKRSGRNQVKLRTGGNAQETDCTANAS
ncbi:diguanylate cyclase [Paraburkholderia sp. J10-1]|uniref:sensor domain-containing diguanylate cyclase n=1 Tax=Paraburkholderia sp. J10-1 TaxID=2805430 RepID=UPI002AB6D865|nr:diguanylate cyclase [Paraburkholderia sp. J10-1]